MNPSQTPEQGRPTRSTAECLTGEWLFGDDFSMEQIEEWFKDEAEGYATLVKSVHTHETSDFSYKALTRHHLYRHLPEPLLLSDVLGIGAAFGHEFLSIGRPIGRLTILEPSDYFASNPLPGLNPTYVHPSSTGTLPFQSDSFDLVTCFGVLHHIPNVSHVLFECARVLRPDGWMLIREPIISMGDWRVARRGLTKRERGIPLEIFARLLRAAGFDIRHRSIAMFPGTQRIFEAARLKPTYNYRLAVVLDRLFCSLTAWNYRYHAVEWWHKIRPTCAFFAVQKPPLRDASGRTPP